MQIRCDDDLFNIIFVEQTCIFNSKDTKENYSNNAARNSNIDEKKNMDEEYYRTNRFGRLRKGKKNCGGEKELKTQSCQPLLSLHIYHKNMF